MDRDFKGIWIPKEVWLDTRLNALEKIILVEIDSLDCEQSGCFASNEYLAEFCQCGITKVSLAIKKLLQLQYIYIISFDGRTRFLKSRLSKTEKQEFKKTNDNNIDNIDNIDLDNNKNINNTDVKKKIEKEKNSIQEIYDYWQSKDIIKHDENTEKRKNAITKVLKNYSIDKIKLAIDHYAEMYHSNYEYCDYKWSLEVFLGREKGFTEFFDDGSKWLNYLNWKKKQQDEKPVEHIGTYLR